MLALAGCQARSRADVPAVIRNPSAESRAELLRVVTSALNGAPVTLADDALTRDSSLVIERARPRDAQGMAATGRETSRPEHFRLVKSGSRCVLVQERTGQRWPLSSVTCAPAPTPP